MSRVALIGENSIEYIDKLIDIWNNGDCAVLIDWRIPLQTAVTNIKNMDLIMVIENGKIIEKGNHDELMKIGGSYFNLFEIQRKNFE